jgi:hypothetical protein
MLGGNIEIGNVNATKNVAHSPNVYISAAIPAA